MSTLRSVSLLDAIETFAKQTPEAIALEGERVSLSYQSLRAETERMAEQLMKLNVQRLALLMDNDPAWVIIDLACRQLGITLIPIPGFFSQAQLLHTLSDAQVTVLLHDGIIQAGMDLAELGVHRPMSRVAGKSCWCVRLPESGKVSGPLHENTAKITYTSGTTGSPKGVCLAQSAMLQVAEGLADVIEVTSVDRHLCLLPLAVLLENIGGIYTPLLRGATCVIPSLGRVGMHGASGIDPVVMLQAVSDYRASSVILLPQMLQAFCAVIAAGTPVPESLRFIAVGGAPVSPRLLAQAESLGLPVFEGYGLSECASVVAVNTPAHNRPGSVGRVLPHVDIAFTAENEILIRGNTFNGYLNGETNDSEAWYASGDLGYLDDDGYLFLTGRQKNCFITSFGRNIAPEWVERELTVTPQIAQAVIIGEARPFNVAIIVPRGEVTEQQLEQAIELANQGLPDYARVSRWMRADAPFSVENHQFTATGRPRRDAIFSAYADSIEQIYFEHEQGNYSLHRERSCHAVF